MPKLKLYIFNTTILLEKVIILDLIITFTITFVLLLLSVYKGIFLAYPLLIALLLFSILAWRRGYELKDILTMAYNGGKKSVIVIKVFILIGAIMAIWMASGTVPAIVYYGVRFIRPDVFILCAFLISCLVSFLIGTSVGTSGTVGIALIVIAKSGGVNAAATAGAIIAGAYFGDRCSPMSSSANLVAYLTETNIYENIKNMFKTCIVPFCGSVIFYYVLSKMFPLHNSANDINNEILRTFSVNMIVLLPALIIIMFSIFKVDVKISMLVSIIIAFLIGVIVQHETVLSCTKFIIFGYSTDKSNPLYTIIQGGGMLSMLKTSLIIYVASAFAGIVDGTKMLNSIEEITQKANSRYEIFRNVAITSIFTAAIGCSQAFAVILTDILNKKAYEKNKIDNYCRSIDLENTAIVIAGLVPWNIALLVPITILGAKASCIPYSFYIYSLPLWNLIFLKFKADKKFT
jgi:NhaC family Na+:H+ antiporter